MVHDHLDTEGPTTCLQIFNHHEGISQKEVREGLGCQGILDRLSAKTHAATNLATLGILAAARGAATIGLFYKGILAATRGFFLATREFWQQGDLVQRGFGSNKRIPIQGNFWQ